MLEMSQHLSQKIQIWSIGETRVIMGIFEKIRQTIIVNFLSSRTNLTLVQCMLYLIIGYVMGQYLDWFRMILMFVLLFGIQFITRTKAVADGMMFGHLMEHNNMKTNEFLRHMKEEADKINKQDLN